MDYESYRTIDSKCRPGVSFTIRRMAFERRVELTRRIRELAQKFEYLEAGKTPQDQIEAALLATEIDRAYLRWGLKEIEGLNIDGSPATAERLLEAGPEDVCREALEAIKAECGLSEAERKN